MEVKFVSRRVGIPEIVRHPIFREREPPLSEIASSERSGREFRDFGITVRDACSEVVAAIRFGTINRRANRQFVFTHRRGHINVLDRRPSGFADEKHVAAQTSSLDCSFHFTGRRTVRVGKHDARQRQRYYKQAQAVRRTRATCRRKIQVAARKKDLTHFHGIHKDRHVGV